MSEDINVGYCDNSRMWVDFMMPRPPKTCPYLGFQGETHCVDHSCGYYREIEPNAYYRRHIAELKRAYE